MPEEGQQQADSQAGTQESSQPQGTQAQEQTASQTGAQTGEKVYTYKEDRSNWFPKDRYDAVNRKFDGAQQEIARYKAELQAERQRVAALAGVNPTDPKAAERERLRAELLDVFPELKGIQPQQEDPTLVEARQAAEHAMQERAAKKTLDLTFSKLAEVSGGDLNDEEKQFAHAALYRWVAADPKLAARWEMGDIEGVVEDFVQGQNFLIERGRRLGSSSTVGRTQPRPNGRSGGMVAQKAAKLDFTKMKNVDEMLAAAEEESVARHKASGTTWGDDQL